MIDQKRKRKKKKMPQHFNSSFPPKGSERSQMLLKCILLSFSMSSIVVRHLIIEQRLANFDLLAKSSLLPIFVDCILRMIFHF